MRQNEPTANRRIAGPIPFYNGAGQLLTGQTFAAAGETAFWNIDTGTFADTTNDAVEIGTSGMYYIQFTQAETNHPSFLVARLRKAGQEDQFFVVPIDNVPDVNVSSYATGQTPLQPTVAGRTLDVTAAGNAGIDWGNVENPATVVGLSGTTVKDASDVETKLGAPVGASVSADIGTLLTASATLLTVVDTLRKAAYGRWRILGTQLIIYDDDGTTPLEIFDLKDVDGNPSSTQIFERVPV